MNLYFQTNNNYVIKFYRCLNCYDFNIDAVIAFLINIDKCNFYINFTTEHDYEVKYDVNNIDKYITILIFYNSENINNPNYKNIYSFGQENLEKLLKLWKFKAIDSGFNNFYTDLCKNYKKYIKEAIIKEIIE